MQVNSRTISIQLNFKAENLGDLPFRSISSMICRVGGRGLLREGKEYLKTERGKGIVDMQQRMEPLWRSLDAILLSYSFPN